MGDADFNDPPVAAAPTAAVAGGGALEPDEAIVAQRVSMGFELNGCKRAAIAVKNSGAEASYPPYPLP